jgi:hypothetical protein
LSSRSVVSRNPCFFLVKHFPALLFAACALVLGACESGPRWPTSLRERIAPTYRRQVVAAEQKPAYEAARAALEEMNFRFVSGGAAQGKLEALGALQPGGGPRSARQLSVNVRFSPAINSPAAIGTEVAILFSEILEDEFSKREGLGTKTPLQDTPLYEGFFRQLETALATPAE